MSCLVCSCWLRGFFFRFFSGKQSRNFSSRSALFRKLNLPDSRQPSWLLHEFSLSRAGSLAWFFRSPSTHTVAQLCLLLLFLSHRKMFRLEQRFLPPSEVNHKEDPLCLCLSRKRRKKATNLDISNFASKFSIPSSDLEWKLSLRKEGKRNSARRQKKSPQWLLNGL